MLDPALIAAVVAVLAAFVVFGWPRRVTHRYELFVAAAPQTVWDNYFVHINKANYRPGTRVIDATVVAERPLTVRIKLQYDITDEPTAYLLVYDVYEPYTRYRLRRSGSNFVEEGEFLSEPGGTRLHMAVTGPMRGFVLPLLARRRVERNQRALRDFCEGRETAGPRGPLPQGQWWEPWVLFAAVFSPMITLPWPVHLVIGAVGVGIAILYLRRFMVFARRL